MAALPRVARTFDRPERLRGKKLERDLIFVVTSAEEEGNVGVEVFARFPGILAGKRIVAAANFDMLGARSSAESPLVGIGMRTGRDFASILANPLTRRAARVRVKGSSLALFSGHKRVPRAFGCSDHAVFAAAGIPALLHMGAVPQQMHSSRDTFGRIDLEAVETSARHGARLPPSISVLLTKADHCSSSTTKLNHDLSPMCLG